MHLGKFLRPNLEKSFSKYARTNSLNAMLEKALNFIKEELLSFLINDLGDSSVEVELGNIALFETENSTGIENKIVISLVNIEEESTLKNARNFQKSISGGIRYLAPPLYLNLYILFACNYSLYAPSIQRLGNILQFFQHRKQFEVSSAQSPQNENAFSDEEADFRLTFELYTLTFEQINHLWGALGGRQLPSVMYKARLVRIDNKDIFRPGPPIEEIQANLILNNEC